MTETIKDKIFAIKNQPMQINAKLEEISQKYLTNKTDENWHILVTVITAVLEADFSKDFVQSALLRIKENLPRMDLETAKKAINQAATSLKSEQTPSL